VLPPAYSPTDFRVRTTARADLAACLLAHVAGDRNVREAIGVVTTAGTPGVLRQLWRAGIRKEKES
jgi:hypothetical protein